MKTIHSFVLATACVVLSTAAWAADKKDHESHHPEKAAAVSNAPAAMGGNAAAKDTMAKMDMQMKMMQDMHEKMMNAKTPEEHDALMAEHMKTMMGGMSMMGDMGGAGKTGMKGGMSADDMEIRHQMMEKRMEMMETTMHMMMDRLPQPPTKSRK